MKGRIIGMSNRGLEEGTVGVDIVRNLLRRSAEQHKGSNLVWKFDPLARTKEQLTGMFRFLIGLGKFVTEQELMEFLAYGLPELFSNSEAVRFEYVDSVPMKDIKHQDGTSLQITSLRGNDVTGDIHFYRDEFGKPAKGVLVFDSSLGKRELARYELTSRHTLVEYGEYFYEMVVVSEDVLKMLVVFTPLFREGCELHWNQCVQEGVEEDYLRYLREERGTPFTVRNLRLALDGRYKKSGGTMYQKFMECIISVVVRRYYEYLSIVESVKRDAEATALYAKAFMTKKSISKKVQRLMEDSPFLDRFSFVEYDNEVDVDLLHKVYREYSTWVSPSLPRNPELFKQGSSFRLRKLGNYRVGGMYFSSRDCVAVDIRDIQSFIHEYAHKFDAALGITRIGDTLLDSILIPYRQEYCRLIRYYEGRGFNVSYYQEKEEYFCGAAEIFARGFERFMRFNVLQAESSFNRSFEEKDLKGLIEYQALDVVQGAIEELICRYWKS